jgi:protein TonB
MGALDQPTLARPPEGAPALPPPAPSWAAAVLLAAVLAAVGCAASTREQRESDQVVVRCTITKAGRAEDCQVLRSSDPETDEAVLNYLGSRSYPPVTYNGVPVDISYVFTLKLNRRPADGGAAALEAEPGPDGGAP